MKMFSHLLYKRSQPFPTRAWVGLILLLPTLAVMLSACSVSAAAPEQPTDAEPAYYLVSAALDSTATPTPFQPSARASSSALVLSPTPGPGDAGSATTIPDVQPLATAVPTVALTPTPVVDIQAIPLTSDIYSILLLGSDTRHGASFRTDTILIALLRPADGMISLISVPRDLWLNIPDVGYQRINTAYQYGELEGYPGGGAGLLKDTILNNFGLHIDHTAMIDFNGFRQTIDTLGGLDVPVACPYSDWRLSDPSLDPEDENNWYMYTAGPGVIHMDGDLSLWYARSRKHSDDFDRGRRQQEVIRSVISKALQSNLIPQIPQLYMALSGAFDTDMGLPDILSFTPMALHLSNADIRSFYIAGDLVTPWVTDGGAFVLLPNTELIQAMIQTAMAPPEQQLTETKKLSIEIQNGTDTTGLDTLAAERLSYAGYHTLLHAADNQQHTTTLLYDLTSGQDNTRQQKLLATLGLSQSALVSAPSKDSKVDYVVILGADYSACFKPSEINP